MAWHGKAKEEGSRQGLGLNGHARQGRAVQGKRRPEICRKGRQSRGSPVMCRQDRDREE